MQHQLFVQEKQQSHSYNYLHIYICNYFISNLINLINLKKPGFHQKLVYIINHYFIEFLQHLLALLFIWLNNTLEKLKSDSSPWYCPICLSEFPFHQMNNKELKSFLKIPKTSATPTQVTSKTNLETKELIKCFKWLKVMLEVWNPS